MKYDKSGWLVIDNKATFVKCCYKNSKSLLYVRVPRRCQYKIIVPQQLHKTKDSCLRRQIKFLRQELILEQNAFEQAQRQVNNTKGKLLILREQLKSAK